MKYSCTLAAIAAFVFLAVGCSSGGNYTIYSKHFPTQTEVAEIKKEDPGEMRFRDASQFGRVPYWKLQGPLPKVWGSRTVRSTTPVGQAVDKSFTKAKMTESVSCYARESGIFYAHYGRYPYERLDEFIRARCGVVGTNNSAANLSWKRAVSEEQIVANDGFDKWLKEHTSAWDKAGWEYGVWKGEGKQGTIIYLVVNRTPATVEPIPLAQPGADEIVIKGELRSDADAIFGLTTIGRFDYGECVTNTAVKLPRFEVKCPVSAKDETATVTIGRGRDEDVFTTYVLGPVFYLAAPPTDTFVAPGATVATKSEPQSDTEADGPKSEPNIFGNPYPNRPALIEKPVQANNVAPEALMRRYLDRVNEIRAEAGREPLELQVEQSQENAALVPLLFGNRSDEDRNQAFLGALAGWKVDGRIIDGHVNSNSYRNADVDDMARSLLSSPSGRRTFLAPQVDSAAIGSVFFEESQTVAILATSYQYVEEEEHVVRVNRFLDKLNKARKARGASSPRKVRALIPVAKRLDKLVRTGKLTFNEAANRLINEAVEEYQDRTFIYYGGAHDPLRLKFNDNLLNMEPLRIGIMVTPFKPEGSPWYIYCVAIAYPETNKVDIAVLGTSPGTMAFAQ